MITLLLSLIVTEVIALLLSLGIVTVTGHCYYCHWLLRSDHIVAVTNCSLLSLMATEVITFCVATDCYRLDRVVANWSLVSLLYLLLFSRSHWCLTLGWKYTQTVSSASLEFSTIIPASTSQRPEALSPCRRRRRLEKYERGR